MIINTAQNGACKNIVDISIQFQKILIFDIENFAISAADILPIRYIGTPLMDSSH